jgi:hypothetical protein
MAHLVYPYKLPDYGDCELVSSLRFAERNMDIDSLWVIGDAPPSLRKDRYHHVFYRGSKLKWLNSMERLIHACHLSTFPDSFTLMNDDFMVTEKVVGDFPHLHREGMGDWVRDYPLGERHRYYRTLVSTAKETGDAFPSFELHCPFPMEKERLLFTAKAHGLPAMKQLRTLYAFDHGIVGERADDRKAYVCEDVRKLYDGKWFSISDGLTSCHQWKSLVAPQCADKSRFEI